MGAYQSPPKPPVQFFGSTIIDPVGSQHQIEYVNAAAGWTNWQTLTTLTLPASPYLFLDEASLGDSRRVYRTTPVP